MEEDERGHTRASQMPERRPDRFFARTLHRCLQTIAPGGSYVNAKTHKSLPRIAKARDPHPRSARFRRLYENSVPDLTRATGAVLISKRLSTIAPSAPLTLRLHPVDSVVIARAQLAPGMHLPGEDATVLEAIPIGHKVATRAIASGEPVRRYGQIIGFATRDIAPGEHVHTQNLAMGDFEREYAFSTLAEPTTYADPSATFQGIRRENGQVATRNYVGLLTSVNCSATVAGYIADAFRRRPFSDDDPLADFPNVDGVVALTHKTGCGMAGDGEGMDVLRRTIGGYSRHPNFAAVIMLGLGCEANQIAQIAETQSLRLGFKLRAMTIQDTGGTAKTVRAGIAARSSSDCFSTSGSSGE